MLKILTNITKGKGKEGDIELLEELSEVSRRRLPLRLGQERSEPGSEHDTLLQG